MDDRTIVAALIAGDLRGLDGAYRSYADRLFTYCRFLLHDADAAADAVHDTFVLASQRAAQLRDPDRLRPWLYAIARNECLRAMRGRLRHLPLEEAGQVPAPVVDPVTGLGAEQVRELIWAAAAGLNPGDRQVFELSIRHDLSAVEVGAVLGVSASHAHARLSRVRAQLDRAIGALLVARTGAGDCADLAAMLQGWDGRFTVLLRKRVSRHIESCSTCADRRRQQVSPAALFSAYATLPLLAVPPELWLRLTSTSTDPGQAATRARIDRRAGRFDRTTGFPGTPRRRNGRTMAALAAAGVLLVLFGAALVVPRLGAADDAARQGPDTGPGLAAPAEPTGPAVSAEPTGSAEPTTATESVDPSSSTPPDGPTDGPPGGPATTAPSSPLEVRALGRVSSCDASGRYALTVSVAAADVLDTAVLTWSATSGSGTGGPSRVAPNPPSPTGGTAEPGGPGDVAAPGGPGDIAPPGGNGVSGDEVTMTVTGTTATARVTGLTGTTVTWQVTIVAADGRQTDTGPAQVGTPCPVAR
ncbi:sigma-70 family RNA polymerase sigma factor [Solwaraspora sp. WMMD406]|uniref:RNA polymerase sigma factor n=1 Tax=Solwaraspora sp. WMMD406 TaxID=3016095 RepID=UPI002415A973|nr:sigma-70 family RNA polymerase sigma factor [Solwaraspora sp. WMMD406]MDG4767298.1 sigma-70 family RNA polymerase sigma factor [Solwaraspora sp. WMMD406]